MLYQKLTISKTVPFVYNQHVKDKMLQNSGLALLNGIMIAVMVTANGLLAEMTSHWTALVIIHLCGLLTAVVVLIVKKKFTNIFTGVPFYIMLGGALGVITILLNNLCVNNIGVTMTLALALVGQIIASGIAEHFGWLGFHKKKITFRKIPAYILMTAGAVVMIVWG